MFAGALAGIPVALFNVQGTAVTAGFGYIGMVSPLQSMIKDSAIPSSVMSNYVSPIVALIVWFVVPVIAGIVAQLIFSKLLKLYQPADFKQEL